MVCQRKPISDCHMSGSAFIYGFLSEIQKHAMSMGIGEGPTASVTPPPVGGMIKQKKPKPMDVVSGGAPVPMKTPVPVPIG